MNITEMEMALRNIADALDRAVTARDGHARSETLRLLAEAIDEAEGLDDVDVQAVIEAERAGVESAITLADLHRDNDDVRVFNEDDLTVVDDGQDRWVCWTVDYAAAIDQLSDTLANVDDADEQLDNTDTGTSAYQVLCNAITGPTIGTLSGVAAGKDRAGIARLCHAVVAAVEAGNVVLDVLEDSARQWLADASDAA